MKKKKMMFEDFLGQIIWSADGVSLKWILELIDSGEFPKEEVAIKLDRLFLETYGFHSIKDVQKRHVAVFADAKLIEIPTKTMELTKLHLKYRPWMLNCMADICNTGVTPLTLLEAPEPEKLHLDVLNEFAKLCKEAGTLSCAVTVLTSKDEELAVQEFGKSKQESVEFFAKLAIECGLTDIVCPAPCIPGFKKLGIISTNPAGIRLPENEIGDQSASSVLTPAKALLLGADRLVIGRPLSGGGRFRENLAKIKANMAGTAA